MGLPSVIRLLGCLQRHGLTPQHLAILVASCEARQSGPVVFHLREGRICRVEALRVVHPTWQRRETEDAAPAAWDASDEDAFP